MPGCWWIQFQVGDTFEMARIVSLEGKIIIQGGCSNQDIKIRNKLTAPTKQRMKERIDRSVCCWSSRPSLRAAGGPAYSLVLWHACWSSGLLLLWNICNQRLCSQDH